MFYRGVPSGGDERKRSLLTTRYWTLNYNPLAMPLDKALDNRTIAGLLYETADLMEIDNADPFRIRSYRNAA